MLAKYEDDRILSSAEPCGGLVLITDRPTLGECRSMSVGVYDVVGLVDRAVVGNAES